MVHPCPEFAFTAESMTVFQHPEKSILHHVLAGFPVACHVIKEIIQCTVMPFKQQAHFIELSGSHREHYCIVSQQIQPGESLSVHKWKPRKGKKVTENPGFIKKSAFIEFLPPIGEIRFLLTEKYMSFAAAKKV
jgi:hypothetical protein